MPKIKKIFQRENLSLIYPWILEYNVLVITLSHPKSAETPGLSHRDPNYTMEVYCISIPTSVGAGD